MLPLVVGEFRAGGDPDLRFAPSGVAVCTISAVASSRKKNESGDWVDDKVTWVQLVGFKRTAENMAESYAKGDLMTVTGKLQVEDWEDNDGNKRKSVKVIVDTIGMSSAFNPVRAIKGDGTSDSSRSEGQAARSTQPASSDPWQSGASSDPWQSAGDEPPF